MKTKGYSLYESSYLKCIRIDCKHKQKATGGQLNLEEVGLMKSGIFSMY